jgi:hypothetical protein
MHFDGTRTKNEIPQDVSVFVFLIPLMTIMQRKLLLEVGAEGTVRSR